MDNIQLNSGAKLSFSYTVTYQQVASTTMIDVKDQDLLKKEKYKDTSPNIYPDISIYSTDSCLKSRWILFNEKTGNKRTYEQVYDDMQQDINTYNS